jgi:hypothetical protein
VFNVKMATFKLKLLAVWKGEGKTRGDVVVFRRSAVGGGCALQ